ncbi:DeoR/GlpR family DNA-binding transcription regulator [Treponema sp.]|uniref:DeoR/GlpR family DNA-binding transcription regulator n=1 Tax=Treponema sp. TaxID=166 RepID=UPI003FA1C159
MKSSRSEILKRHNRILKKIAEERSVIVEDLADELHVSALTVRRDLDELAAKGLVERFYGGARYVEHTLRTDPAADREDTEYEHKKRLIAKAAASLVKEGDTILINSSSTAFYMFDFLADMKITVITNNANALHTVDDAKFELIFTGGEINTFKHSMVGSFAQHMLKSIRANKCFIGVSGITEEGRLSTAVLQETAMNTGMMHQTNESVVILADSRKIGIQHNFDIGALDNATHIITDSGISASQLHILQKHGIEVIIAK